MRYRTTGLLSCRVGGTPVKILNPMRQFLLRFARIARTINIWLLAAAAGRGVLDLTVLVGKDVEALAVAAPANSLSYPAGTAATHDQQADHG